MPSYKLTYFNGRGRAENIRLCFAAKGVKYEDKRIDSTEWQQLKPKTTHGFLPVLEFDGKSLSQSTAILCFVARELGLYGKSNYESAKVDEVICTLNDFVDKMIKVVFEKDETKKAAAMKDLLDVAVPKTLTIFKDMLGTNRWLVGSEMTVADLAVYNTFESVVTMAKDQCGMDIFAEYRALKEHADRVKSTPNIKKWLETRPVTSF